MKKTLLFALCSLLLTVGIYTPAPAQITPDIPFPEISEETCQDIANIQQKNNMFKRDSKDNRIITLGDLKYFLTWSHGIGNDVHQNSYELHYNGEEVGRINITRYAHDIDFSNIEKEMQSDFSCSYPSWILTNAPFGQEHICTVIADRKYVVNRLIQAEDGYYYLFAVTDWTITVPNWEGGEDAQTKERWKRLFQIVQNTKPKVITQGFVEVDGTFGRDSYYN